MATSTILLIVAIVVTFVCATFVGGKLPAPFGARSCQGKDWRHSFPDASKEEIQKFLSMFTDCFAFDDKYKLKFNPNDQLLDIYRALYPHKWQADALEFETLAEVLESEYEVNLSNIWRDALTLGQLFSSIRQSPKWGSTFHSNGTTLKRSPLT